jgi:hypothetical protein
VEVAGYQVLADKEADLDPTASTPAPFPRALRHQFSATTPTAAAPSLPVIRLDVRRGLTGDELRERAAVDRCARRTRVRGHTGWLLGGTSLVEAQAPTPTGQPCSLDREIGLVWTEHDDVTIQVVVDASLDAVDPNGVDLLRRFAEHLRAR